MANKVYHAVVERPGTPTTLELICSGSKAECSGALSGWARAKGVAIGEAPPDVTLRLLVEVSD